MPRGPRHWPSGASSPAEPASASACRARAGADCMPSTWTRKIQAHGASSRGSSCPAAADWRKLSGSRLTSGSRSRRWRRLSSCSRQRCSSRWADSSSLPPVCAAQAQPHTSNRTNTTRRAGPRRGGHKAAVQARANWGIRAPDLKGWTLGQRASPSSRAPAMRRHADRREVPGTVEIERAHAHRAEDGGSGGGAPPPAFRPDRPPRRRGQAARRLIPPGCGSPRGRPARRR